LPSSVREGIKNQEVYTVSEGEERKEMGTRAIDGKLITSRVL